MIGAKSPVKPAFNISLELVTTLSLRTAEELAKAVQSNIWEDSRMIIAERRFQVNTKFHF